MRPAAFALVLALAAASAAAGPALPATRIGGLDYVKLDDGAAAMGSRIERINAQSVLLKDGVPSPWPGSSTIAARSDVNGLRVFMGDPVDRARREFLSEPARL